MTTSFLLFASLLALLVFPSSVIVLACNDVLLESELELPTPPEEALSVVQIYTYSRDEDYTIPGRFQVRVHEVLSGNEEYAGYNGYIWINVTSTDECERVPEFPLQPNAYYVIIGLEKISKDEYSVKDLAYINEVEEDTYGSLKRVDDREWREYLREYSAIPRESEFTKSVFGWVNAHQWWVVGGAVSLFIFRVWAMMLNGGGRSFR